MKNAFLALPPRDLAPSGYCKFDTFISMKQMNFHANPPPRAATIMIPSARFQFRSIHGIKSENPVAHEEYPKLINTFYAAFFNEPIMHQRPTKVLVDDPVLASYLKSDLDGTGTDVILVNEATYLIDESKYSNGEIVKKSEIPLLQVSIGTWEDLQQMTIQQIGLSKKSPDQMIYRNKDAGVRESNKAPGKYKLNGSRSKELEYPTPISLHACNFQECGKIAIGHKKCGRCLCAFYCCQEHQQSDWKIHKKQCVSVSSGK